MLESTADASEITPAVAAWLGWQAARLGRVDEGRDLVPADLMGHYDGGADLPESISMMCPGGENLRRRLLRRLGGDPEPKRTVRPLAVSIVGMVRRPDVGTATRYNVTLERDGRRVVLRDLVASDLLTFSRLRPIAMDAGLVLAELEKGQARLWLAEVERATDSALVVPLAPEESEAGEILDTIAEIMADAREWTWSDDDTYPRGIALVRHDGMEGWTRGPVQDAIRARLGRVSRVALSRSLAHLGMVRADWRIETAYVRVWARKAVKS